MIARVRYKEAKARMPDDCERDGTTAAQLREALLSFGIATEEKRPIGNKEFRSFPFDAVLHGWAEDEWHWVVWDYRRKKVIDPYEPPTKFCCKSFIRIVSVPPS